MAEDAWDAGFCPAELEDPPLISAQLAERLRDQLAGKAAPPRLTRHPSLELDPRPPPLLPEAPATPGGMDRTQSLHNQHSRVHSAGSQHLGSLCSSRSLGSLRSAASSLQSFEPAPARDDGKSSADSGLADSVCSKRSSLDRKSVCSSVLSGDWAGAESGDAATSDRRPRLPIPTISLPKISFGRKSSDSGTWRLFSASKGASPVSSTTGLILQNRPSNLPAKSEEEEAKHRRLYQEMVEASKRRDAREAKARKKAEEEQKKAEEALSNQTRLWSTTYLPRWNEMRENRRCRDLWWLGLPPSVRGRVWKLAIGNDLNLTPDLYEICASRAQERLANPEPEPAVEELSGHARTPSAASFAARLAAESLVVNRESTVELVHLDVSRTFPGLGIFQKGGPYYDLLLNLLGAYVCYRPDVGYVQGMSFIAAVLLLNMEPAEAFIAFANLLNRPLQLALFRVRQPEMARYFAAFDAYFRQECPRLHAHFAALDIAPDLYLIEWMYTLYAKTLPLDVTCRVWDVYLRDGEDFLFKTAVGLMSLLEPVLVDADFDGCLQLLSQLPSQYSASEPLFKAIEPLYKKEGSSDRKRFTQILAEVEVSGGGGLSGSRSLGSLRSVSPSYSVRSGPPKSLSGLLPDWLTKDSHA